MTFSRRNFLIIAVSMTVAACGGARRAPATPGAETTVRVRNQGFLDRVIYLVAGSQRIRLGQVTGNSTAVLRIPQQYVFGASQMRFIADPIGSNVAPISESITVIPGDEVILTIPPG